MARHELDHAPIDATYVLWRTHIPTPRWFDNGHGPKDRRGDYWSDHLWAWMRSHGLIRVIEKRRAGGKK